MTPAARRTVRTGVAALGLALVAAPLATAPTASASDTGLVVSEVYGGAGTRVPRCATTSSSCTTPPAHR